MENQAPAIPSILVVDDTEANVDVLVETLGDDYDVTVAMDGPTALEIAQESSPDLILLDIMMPGMDGYEVCRRLKADERTRDVPVVFVTAMGEVEDETKGLELGAVDYVTKPISPPVVRARVSTHLGLQKKTRELSDLSRKLSKYLAPQVYVSIFRGEQDVRIESKRKKLSVFFSDIVNFTQTTEDMESEDLSKLLNNYLEEMAAIALKHGGTIDKFIGDAILVFFGDPLSRGETEDAMACVSMALEMRTRMQELQQTWYGYGVQEPFRVRSGISTGYCTVGNFGSRNRMDYTIIGSQVNLAARLESAATPDQILISHETWSIVKDQVYCIKLQPVTVKGIGHPVQSYQVVDFLENMGTAKNAITIEFLAEETPIVDASTTVKELRASVGDVGPGDAIAIVTSGEDAIGCVMGRHLLYASSSAENVAAYFDQSVTNIVDESSLVVEAETPLAQVGDRAMSRDPSAIYDPIVVTAAGKPAGLVPMHVLMKKLIELAQPPGDVAELDS